LQHQISFACGLLLAVLAIGHQILYAVIITGADLATTELFMCAGITPEAVQGTAAQSYVCWFYYW
jgi:hypothetical protein